MADVQRVSVPGSRSTACSTLGAASPGAFLSPVSCLACFDAISCSLSSYTDLSLPWQMQITLFCPRKLPTATISPLNWQGDVRGEMVAGISSVSNAQPCGVALEGFFVVVVGFLWWHNVSQMLCPKILLAILVGMLSHAMGCLSSSASKMCHWDVSQGASGWVHHPLVPIAVSLQLRGVCSGIVICFFT